MAYWKDIWRFRESIEYEYKYAGNYGAKGEKRTKKKKASPEQIKKQNQKNKETRMRRLIKANFVEGDIWGTLKYPAGIRKTVWEIMDDLSKFQGKMRYQYKKRGEPFKWVTRMEIGKEGGIHIHILLNRVRGEPAIDELMQEKWIHGRVYYTSIYDAGGFEKLAAYITKQPKEEAAEQMSLFPEEEQKELVKYSSSRNLIRPEPERKVYSRWTVRKLVDEGPKPTPGYFIDPNSIVNGINPYTGMSYYKYIEVKIERHRKGAG